MKTTFSRITTICALFMSASLADAQVRPINPGPMPINPGPIGPGPIKIDPGPIKIDPGPIKIDPGPIKIDPGPIRIDPGPVNPPPPPPITVGQAFVIAVCAGTSDYSDDCRKRGEAEAAERLTGFYLKQYAKRYIQSSLTVRFPDVASRTEQIRFLLKVEKQVIKAVEAQLQADVAQLTPFRWDTEQDRQRKQAVVTETAKTVKQWAEKARAEADSGTNWSHDSSSNSHKFNEGEAFKQLKHISIHGWTNQ